MRYSFIILLVFLQVTIYGQQSYREAEKQEIATLKPEAKNNIYIAGGTWVIGWDATVNYERMILHFGRRRSTSLY